MSFTYKALLCILRRIRRKDPIYHKSIAGFISGLWIVLDNKKRRKTLALYLIVRMIGDWIKLIQYNRASKLKCKSIYQNTENVENIDHDTSTVNTVNNKTNSNGNKLKHIGNITQLQNQTLMQRIIAGLTKGEVITFTLSQMVIMYGAIHATHCIDSSYYKWIKNMGNLTEKQMQHTMRSRIDVNSMYRLPSEKWQPCHPFWHKDVSCLRANVTDFFKCILRAGKMYLPVHFLPMLLFTPKIVLNNLVTFVKLKLFNTLRSAIFLSFYVFNMKQSICMLRNVFKDDTAYISFVGGFMAGLSILIEQSKRRMELCLYVVPRAIEILLRLIPKNMRLLYRFFRLKHLPVFSFALAMGGWMTLIATKNGTKCANGLNMTGLRVIFGSLH